MAHMARETQSLTVLFADITESSRLYHQLGDETARKAIKASSQYNLNNFFCLNRFFDDVWSANVS